MTESTLGDISKVMKTGKTPPSKNQFYFEDDFNWYTPGDIHYTKYINSSQRHISNSALEDGKASLYDENSLLITCIGNIGRVGISKEKCASNQQITAITPIDEVNVEYLYYWFIKNQNLLSAISNNAVVPILNNRTLKRVKFNFPPLETQKRIAQILDDAAALRDTTAQLLKEYDLLAQSIFLEMFGDPVLNSKGWDTQTIKTLGKTTTGNTPSRNVSENFGDFIEWIKTDNINTPDTTLTRASESLSEQGLLKARSVKKGAVLVTCIAGSRKVIGNVALADRRVSFNQQINAFEPHNKCSMFWYYHFIVAKSYVQNNSTNGMKGIITKGKFEKMLFINPPIELQNQFADKIALIEQQKALAKQELQESEDLFNCLLQKAFKGELV